MTRIATALAVLLLVPACDEQADEGMGQVSGAMGIDGRCPDDEAFEAGQAEVCSERVGDVTTSDAVISNPMAGCGMAEDPIACVCTVAAVELRAEAIDEECDGDEACTTVLTAYATTIPLDLADCIADGGIEDGIYPDACPTPRTDEVDAWREASSCAG